MSLIQNVKFSKNKKGTESNFEGARSNVKSVKS